MQRLSRSLITLVLISVAFLGGSFAPCADTAGQLPKAAAIARQKPRLVLLIVVDQFRYDYLERFADLFGPRGIKRLMNEGAFWLNTNYEHTATQTAPGHAAMMTGAPPAASGIVANEWIDRQLAKKVTSVTDGKVKALGGGPKESTYSPHLLMGSTLGDELRRATNDRGKVIGISEKARAAILSTGRRANGAYWLSSDTGTFVSSNYYFPELPGWVEEFNRTRPANEYFGAWWERLLPEKEYLKRAGPDSPPWENIGTVRGETNAFPHKITGGSRGPDRAFYEALDHSPFLNELLVAFAKQAITSEQLGRDDDTDILTVSLSANDHVGHRFGPFSHEVMDITLRADRDIGVLLDFVDAQVGLRNTIVVFTADHGVAPLPEHAAVLGLGGARIRPDQVLQAVRAAISSRYNPKRKSPDPTVDYILKYDRTKDGMINGNIYFNLAALRRDAVNREEIEELAGKAALQVPGIARYFTRSQLQRGSVSETDPVARRVRHGFYPGRSGDVIVIHEPFKYLGDAVTRASHGTPYSYDTHVPQIIFGESFRQGRFSQAASPADIGPTLAVVLGIKPPSRSTGRALVESFKRDR